MYDIPTIAEVKRVGNRYYIYINQPGNLKEILLTSMSNGLAAKRLALELNKGLEKWLS